MAEESQVGEGTRAYAADATRHVSREHSPTSARFVPCLLTTTMSFAGFGDDTPEWGLPASSSGDVVTNAIKNTAIKKEKLIK